MHNENKRRIEVPALIVPAHSLVLPFVTWSFGEQDFETKVIHFHAVGGEQGSKILFFILFTFYLIFFSIFFLSYVCEFGGGKGIKRERGKSTNRRRHKDSSAAAKFRNLQTNEQQTRSCTAIIRRE